MFRRQGGVAVALAALAIAVVSGCFEEDARPEDASVPGADAGAPPAARHVVMDYASERFYDAPFPGEHLRRADGTIDLSRAPNPLRTTIVQQIHHALERIDGFGATSPIHFHLDGEIDRSSIPSDPFASLAPSSALSIVDVDAGSPERGVRRPFEAFFQSDAGPYGDAHLLTLLPVQGVPLRSSTRYAVIVTDALRGSDGAPLERAPALHEIAAGRAPAGMSDAARAEFAAAWGELEATGVAIDRVVGMTVFRTGDPLDVMRRAVAGTEGRFAPAEVEPLALREVYDDYCAYSGVVRMPVFQQGEPPYLMEGGAWALDADGTPILQREEDAVIWVTLPRAAMPGGGFPVAVLIRTGAGGDRPLVDRGVRDASGEPLSAGSGPAMEFARAGLAGVSVEGPHGGSRNVSGSDEQFLVFNIQNPIALRDNLRQSALELVLLARALDTMVLDASGCPDLGTPSGDGAARFDTAHTALMGHSMGASIAPLAAAFEPRFAALVLSGAGGSWIENVIHKERPIATRPAAEAMLRYTAIRRTLTADDPALGLLQWAGEAADAQLYARALIAEPESGAPRHVLMFQGIVDHYILPPIANALSLSLAIDRAGPGLDATTPAVSAYTPLEDLLPLRGRAGISLPVSGNVAIDGGGAVTAVVAQHAEDGVEDGHETVFQTEAPKVQYRCFLRTFAQGIVPIVPDPAAPGAACGE